MANPEDRPRWRDGVLTQEAGATTVLLDPATGEYFSLDEVGGRIWTLCDGNRTVEQICDILLEEYEVDRETMMSDLLEILAALEADRLVTHAP